MPTNGASFRGLETTYFSVQIIAINNKQPNEKNKLNILIDFYNVESFDGVGEKFDKMRDDFNLPFGKGCSGFVEQIQPDVTSQSFSLKYEQQSRGETILMAYDHIGGYLRKEPSEDEMSVWDINENLFYHIDKTAPSFKSYTSYSGEMLICSVMDVYDDKLGSAFRPYEKSEKSLDVLKMLGASFVGFLGRSTVRDLPCLVFESIVTEPPVIFGLTEDQSNKKKTKTRDYIVQFYILEGKRSYSRDISLLPENGFWPARIVLFRRLLDQVTIEFVDKLEIYDFYWSLDGWDKKGTRLFMAEECFDDEDEQLRLNAAISFDRIHKGYTKFEDMILLPMNKFKLEFYLINVIFDNFQISKMHLVDYTLKLKPHHVDLNMIIGDRKEDKKLVYYGEGQLPEPDSYETNRVILTGLSEMSCVLKSSHIQDISLVVYCPKDLIFNTDYSTCIAIYDQHEPTISSSNHDKFDAKTQVCQIYRFEESTIAKKGTNIVHNQAESLYLKPINFVAQVPNVPGKLDSLKGVIKNYDISQEVKLVTIDRYMFVVDNNNIEQEQQLTSDKTNNDIQEQQQLSVGHNHRVRSFDSITYKSVEDCARMCNLDAHCRSYSYCSNKSANRERCILSSLDIRNSKVLEQLVNLNLDSNNQIQINGNDNQKYNLKLESSCNIFEHNYLSMFRQTDEIIRIDRSIANQYKKALTTFDCAKQSVDLESSSSEHHVAMFAYCTVSNTCLMDENLFSISSGNLEYNNTDRDKENDDEKRKDAAKSDHELVCRIYRKLYQTYFEVSAKILRKETFADKQDKLPFNNVEECARACWIPLGEVCASFDYCSPGSCIINRIGLKDVDTSNDVETSEGCLHYERDLKLDELRKKHLIGRQQILGGLNNGASNDSMSVGKFFSNLFTYSIVFCAFVYGLFLGRQMSDKMDAVSILRQSVSNGAGLGGAGQMFPFPTTLNGFHDNSNRDTSDNIYDVPDDDVDGGGNEGGGGSNAIRMDVIKSGSNDRDPLERDF